MERHPQPRHTGMSYSKQHYILHEQEIYTNIGQHGYLLHSESEAEGIYTGYIILIGNQTINKQNHKTGF